jgi:hypothetical protein
MARAQLLALLVVLERRAAQPAHAVTNRPSAKTVSLHRLDAVLSDLQLAGIQFMAARGDRFDLRPNERCS